MKPTEKKMYSKIFLLQLKNKPICQKKPDVLKNWDIIVNSSNPQQYELLGINSLEVPILIIIILNTVFNYILIKCDFNYILENCT